AREANRRNRRRCPSRRHRQVDRERSLPRPEVRSRLARHRRRRRNDRWERPWEGGMSRELEVALSALRSVGAAAGFSARELDDEAAAYAASICADDASVAA